MYHMCRVKLLVSTALFLTTLSLSPAYANLIGNGSFETPVINTPFEVFGNGAAGVFQFIATVPGTAYAFRFWYADNPFSNAEGSQAGVPKTGAWTIRDGSTNAILLPLGNFTHDTTTGADADWRDSGVFMFVATNASTRIAFSGDAALLSTGPMIDNVQALQRRGLPRRQRRRRLREEAAAHRARARAPARHRGRHRLQAPGLPAGGDTHQHLLSTVVDAASQLERAGAPYRLDDLIADKGYHSNRTLIDLDALAVRAYIAAMNKENWVAATAGAQQRMATADNVTCCRTCHAVKANMATIKMVPASASSAAGNPY